MASENVTKEDCFRLTATRCLGSYAPAIDSSEAPKVLAAIRWFEAAPVDELEPFSTLCRVGQTGTLFQYYGALRDCQFNVPGFAFLAIEAFDRQMLEHVAGP